ncbi:unnamed protein product [Notodromas monacha]|uniref:Dual specificity protein phosphatase n=1 Tax=Notodromas monacha TaxID=399045 RepID=A0A7R9BRB7_9CRUS|nr:unnamed protein product [Notodromas monacha]CAG0920267.1 unnamed protein product [Notodromas monacha]
MSSWRSRLSRSSCTVDDLIEIIKAPSGGAYAFPTEPYNEVYPGIFIGDAHTALCTGVLRSLGIRHVVNAAHSRNKREGLEVIEEFDPFVRTTEAYYERAGIRFYPVPAIDLTHFRLAPFFRDAADFIDEALASGDPKALRATGVTAVVNAAEGADWCRYVDTGPSFYSAVKLPVSYYGIKALDCSTFQLYTYFDSVSSFINDNLQAGGTRETSAV